MLLQGTLLTQTKTHQAAGVRRGSLEATRAERPFWAVLVARPAVTMWPFKVRKWTLLARCAESVKLQGVGAHPLLTRLVCERKVVRTGEHQNQA